VNADAAVMLASMTGNTLFTALTGIVCGCAVIGLIYKLIDGKACIDRILYPVGE
jgi:hypothetical protein